MSQETAQTIKPKKVPLPRWAVKGAWRAHRGLYNITKGRKGLRPPTEDLYGMIRLRTIGRKSGQERPVILAYFEDGDDLIVIPMNGWAEPEPLWWLNLQEQPNASVDLPGGDVKDVRARLASPEERSRLWKIAADGTWGSDMDNYAAGRGRETQIVILEPR